MGLSPTGERRKTMKRIRLSARLSLVSMVMLALVTLGVGGPTTGTALADTGHDKPNDVTQGRLRINQCVQGAPLVDVYVNGQVAVNGGVPQTNVPLETTGYLYLTPGKYNVSLVPSGQGLDHA